jgi:hypothetical protein
MHSAFETYKLYLALKMHFSSDGYDFFRYHGKVRANKEKFEMNNTKYAFAKLSRKSDPQGLIIANFVARGTNIWVGDLLTPQGEEIYVKWKGKQESLSYIFNSDLNKLPDDLDEALAPPAKFAYPLLLKMYLHGEVEIETLILLQEKFKFLSYWKEILSLYDPAWKNTLNLMVKYKGFMVFDKEKIMNIIGKKY